MTTPTTPIDPDDIGPQVPPLQPAQPPEPPPQPGPPRRRRPGRAIALGIALFLLLLVVVIGGGVSWALGSARGSAWLLSVLPGVQVEAPRGALASDFSARQVVVDLSRIGGGKDAGTGAASGNGHGNGSDTRPNGGNGGNGSNGSSHGSHDQVILTDVAWHGLALGRGEGRPWARLTIAALHIGRIELALTPKPAPKESPPRTAPTDLGLPIELDLQSLTVGEIRATPLGNAAITGLDAALHLGAGGGAVHRIDRLALRYEQIAVTAQGRIATASPLALDATGDASQPAAGALPAWAARLHLAGPLAEPLLDASLRAEPVAASAAAAARPATRSTAAGSAAARSPQAGAAMAPSTAAASAPLTAATAAAGSTSRAPAASPGSAARPPQTLDLHAALRPFAPWPLGDLTATARGLDLSTFVATAPSTALDIEARASSSGADRPAVVSLDLVNRAPGRYDEHRLPVQSLTAQIAARPDRASEIELRSLSLALGGAAGRAAGGSSDATSAGRLTAQGHWSPSRWQVDAALDGVRTQRLDGRAPPLTLSGPVNAAGGAAAGNGSGIDLKVALSGQLQNPGGTTTPARPVALRLDTSVDLAGPQKRLRIAELLASAGGASLKAAGTATQADAAAPWVVKADAALAEFDPGAWLPVDAKSPWRGAKNRIDARLAVDGSAALPAAGTPMIDALAQARGHASLRIEPNTVLAGVALGGGAALQIDTGNTGRVKADIDAGGNALRLDGRFATRGKTSGDAFDLAGDARTLATLAPVFRLFQPAGADATLAGRLTAHAHIDGRWPAVTTRGDLDADGVRAGAWSLQRAVAQWAAGTGPTDRVSLDATIDGLRLQPAGGAAGPSLESGTVRLAGTARAHTLDLRLTSRVRPPAWAEATTDLAGRTTPAPAAVTAATAPGSTAVAANPGAGAGAGSSHGNGRRTGDGIGNITGTGPAAGSHTVTGAAAAKNASVASSSRSSSSSSPPPTHLTVATLSARGGLVDRNGAALAGWRGTLGTVDVTSNDTGAAPLLRGRDLALKAFWAGGPAEASVQPGRIDLLGGGVRWSRLGYTAAPLPAAAVTPRRAGAAAKVAPSTSPSPSAGNDANPLPRIDIDATLEPLRVAPLLAQAQPSFGWGGDLTLGGHVRLKTGDAGNTVGGGVQADVVVERSGGDLTLTDELGTRPLGLGDLRLALQAERGLWHLTTRLAGAALGTATIDASVRTSPQALLPTMDAPITGWVGLDIADLGALGSWVPPGWRVGGTLRADATLAGTVGKPDYSGELVGSHITARNFLEGVNATDGDLRLRLAGTTATIDHFTVKGGDGQLRITGGANLDAAANDIRLDITADRFQLLGRIDRKAVVSGHAALRIDPRTVAVTGQFNVDQGLIDITRSDAPKLDEDVTVTRAAGALSPEAAASAAASPVRNDPVPTVAIAGPPATDPPAPARTLDLNLQLDLGQQLAIRGHGLAARLAGVLKVSSPQSKVAINGTVSVVDGTFKAYGQDLVIDRGLIVFSGPVDRPRLDIEATRPKLENVRVGVTITGNASNPRIRLFSEPELSDVDKLSWLVVGRGSDDLGRNESALLQSAAMALVSGEGNGEPGITDRVTKALGLDELSVGQSEGATKQTVVNLGKKLSDRWTINYQGGLNATAGSVQLIYRLAKRLTIRAQAGTESSLDVIWSWRWQ